jgi:hypothetical protein
MRGSFNINQKEKMEIEAETVSASVVGHSLVKAKQISWIPT